MFSLLFLSLSVQEKVVFPQIAQMQSIALQTTINIPPSLAKKPPFVSQLEDITAPEWKKIGCGIASLTMVIEFYKPNTVSVNKLLKEGIAVGAYLQNAGWTYKGLIQVAKKYGFEGSSHDLGKLDKQAALTQFKKALAQGPVIASVHYKFDPQSSIPHLVVINRIEGDTMYYNDPAAKEGDKKISVDNFLKAWKKRYIVVRPSAEGVAVHTTSVYEAM